jgi:hypothetical protein
MVCEKAASLADMETLLLLLLLHGKEVLPSIEDPTADLHDGSI